MKTLKLAVIFLFLLITGSRIAKAQDLQPLLCTDFGGSSLI
jgi:hypothetical protein